MNKKTAILLLSALAAGSLSAAPEAAQTNNLSLEEVNVIGHRAQVESEALRVVTSITARELQALPVTCLGDVLDLLPGIDVRTRGAGGAQSDISMRGGTFDQVLIMLNGVNLTDPQTGHYSMDLPVDVSQIERIEVLQGTGMNLFGLSAFSGAVNIITKPQADLDISRTDVRLTGGEHGLFSPMVGMRRQVAGKWQASGYVRHDQSQGYMHNTDYQLTDLYAQGGVNDRPWGSLQAQVGGQIKNYGANSFYSLKYPNQFDATRSLFTTLQWGKSWKQFHLDASTYWRTHYDRFELIRGMVDAPAWYTGHNYHVTHVNGFNLQGSYASRIGRTSAGVELRNEYIKSNVLGDPLDSPKPVPFTSDTSFIYGKDRFNVNYFAEQAVFSGRWAASAGISGNWNTMFGHNFCLGANVGYRFADQGRVYLNLNRSLRLPTFTDLYYKSATQQSNPDLKPEKALTAELGVKWGDSHWDLQANVYYRAGREIIDWVKAPEEEKWRSVNHTDVNALGTDLTVGYRPDKFVRLAQLSYAYTTLDKDAGNLMSMYALDYLKHKLVLRLDHDIYSHFGATWTLSWQSREGSYTSVEGKVESYSPFALLDGRIYWQNGRVNIFGECSNIFNTDYYDYGGIRQPGRWIRAGIALTL